jgi:hypothetical protein
MRRLSIFFFVLFLSGVIQAHEPEVHQYIVREAWKLLKYQIPQMSSTDINNWVGTDETEYLYKIVSGAWNEDQQDIIYMNCGWNFITGCVMTTVNHFWSADAGDYSTFNWNGSHDNALVKAKHMYYGTHHWYYGRPGQTTDYIWKVDHFGLINLYQTGNFARYGYWNINGEWFTDNPPYTDYYSPTYRKRISYDILGRLCHLIGDMSVPAHAHNDAHSPLSQEGEDDYEQWIANGGYDDYTYIDAFNDGGTLFEVVDMNYPIRYLFYVVNQYADFFPSDGDWSGLYMGDRNYYNSFSDGGYSDDYPILDEIFNALGDPPSSVNNSNQAAHLMPFVIRATSSLLYLFAVNTGQIEPVSEFNMGFHNNFTEVQHNGKLKVVDTIYDDIESANPFEVQQGQNISFESLNQTYNGITYTFDHWQDQITSKTRTMPADPEQDTFTAYFNGKPTWITGFTFTCDLGDPISFTWDQHVNSNVKYRIYRKTRDQYGHTTGPTLLVTKNNNQTSYTDNDYTKASTYIYLISYDVRAYYTVEQTEADQYWRSIYGGVLLWKTNTDSIAASSEISSEFQMHNFPNPFNPTTNIIFSLPEASMIKLDIYNSSGQHIKELVNGFRSVGVHVTQWDGTNDQNIKVSSGTYFLISQMPSKIYNRKILLLK